MSTEAPPIERIFRELQTLPPEERLRLVGRIVDSLLPTLSPKSHRPLIYGEFHGLHLSCEEDFREAEWHPQDRDLDGP